MEGITFRPFFRGWPKELFLSPGSPLQKYIRAFALLAENRFPLTTDRPSLYLEPRNFFVLPSSFHPLGTFRALSLGVFGLCY